MTRFWWRALRRLARRPDLWPTALVQAGRLARPAWWRRPPFLPWDRGYVRFRLETQYGSPARGELVTIAEASDLVTYLEWCRALAPGRRTPGR